jgi:CYTH domain-containing protein
MPTEFEYKYVLHQDLLEEDVEKACFEKKEIVQGWLFDDKGVCLRIRRSLTASTIEWFVTMKCYIPPSGRVIEIENSLDSRDGEDLLRQCKYSMLKHRYVIKHEGLKWEVDFLKNFNQTYFILAEIELPENSPRPTSVPDCIKDHVLYQVPIGNMRCNNTLLRNVDYAQELYYTLLKDKK